jgi:hypothetical protein
MAKPPRLLDEIQPGDLEDLRLSILQSGIAPEYDGASSTTGEQELKQRPQEVCCSLYFQSIRLSMHQQESLTRMIRFAQMELVQSQ